MITADMETEVLPAAWLSSSNSPDKGSSPALAATPGLVWSYVGAQDT